MADNMAWLYLPPLPSGLAWPSCASCLAWLYPLPHLPCLAWPGLAVPLIPAWPGCNCSSLRAWPGLAVPPIPAWPGCTCSHSVPGLTVPPIPAWPGCTQEAWPSLFVPRLPWGMAPCSFSLVLAAQASPVSFPKEGSGSIHSFKFYINKKGRSGNALSFLSSPESIFGPGWG